MQNRATNRSINCVILSNERRDVIAATEMSAANAAKVKPAGNTLATNTTFKITDTEFYFAVVTLSTEIDSKFLD